MTQTFCQEMETFSFGFPPDGKAAILPAGDDPIPEPFRSAIAAQHETDYPGAYITAAVDHDLGLVALYHRTGHDWIQVDRVAEIVLQPTLPAKGGGLIEVHWLPERKSYPGGCIFSPGYTEGMHKWMADRASRLASMIGCEFREADPWSDC